MNHSSLKETIVIAMVAVAASISWLLAFVVAPLTFA